MKTAKACAFLLLTMAASDAPAAPAADIAEVYLRTILGSARTQLVVSQVDGERTSSMFKKRLGVPAGDHELVVRTGALRVPGQSKLVNGVASLRFSAKAGYTYTFWAASDSGFFSASSKICIYEEPTDDPGARVSATREFRAPGDNSVEVSCATMSLE